MDCEYILETLCERRRNRYPLHANTTEEAIQDAKAIVKKEQTEILEEFPFTPIVVTAQLYRWFAELDGEEFIVEG